LQNTVDQLSNAIISQVAGTSIDLTDKINESNVSYEDLYVSLKSTANAIGSINNNASDYDKEEAILELLLNLKPETAHVVNEIITEELVIKQGVPKKISKPSSKALRKAFVEMAYLPEDEHESEAKYITKMFELSIYAKDKNKKNNIIGAGGLFRSEEELVETTLYSKVAAASVREISIDADGDPIYDALKISDDLTDVNKYNITNHMKNIYEDAKRNNASADELNELKSRINVASYLLVLDIDFLD